MKLKYNAEIISGAVFAVVGAVLWLLIPSQIQTMEKGVVNAQTLPRIAIGGMFLFAVGLLLEGLFAKENAAVFAITKEGFSIVSFGFLFSGCNIFASACLTALSKGKASAAISFLRTFGWITVLLLTLPKVFQVMGVWLAIPLAELLTLGVTVPVVRCTITR